VTINASDGLLAACMKGLTMIKLALPSTLTMAWVALDFIMNLKKSCWISKSHVERRDRFPIHKCVNKIKWTTFLPCQYCSKLILTNNQNHHKIMKHLIFLFEWLKKKVFTLMWINFQIPTCKSKFQVGFNDYK